MLTGRSDLPSGFDPNGPRPGDWPSIAAVAGALTVPRNNLPPAVVLPETLVHNTGRIIPGQFAGLMGPRRDPWFIEASPFDPTGYGAYPAFEFDHQERQQPPKTEAFPGPEPGLARGFLAHAALGRMSLLECIDHQRAALDAWRKRAVRPVSPGRHLALDRREGQSRLSTCVDAEPKVLDRYGRHAFGWSLLMARRLVEAGSISFRSTWATTRPGTRTATCSPT